MMGGRIGGAVGGGSVGGGSVGGGSVGGGFVAGGFVGGMFVGGTLVGGGLVEARTGVEVGVSRSLWSFVSVGGMGVGDGDGVGVLDGAIVGDGVDVKTGEMAVEVDVEDGKLMTVAGRVGDTFNVGVTEPSPVPGMMRSGS